MKKLNKLISVIICLAMVFAYVPAAFAAEGDVYTLVTDAAELAVGDQIIIVAADYDYAMSNYQKTNNRGQVSITKDGNTAIEGAPETDYQNVAQVLTLEAGTVDGTFAFNTGSGYLYAASSSSNHLKTETTLSANSSWQITITDGIASVIAQGENTRNVMQYNAQSTLFACYDSAKMQAISIYKLADGTEGGGDEGGEDVTGPEGTAADPFIIESLPTKLTGTLTEDNYDIGYFYRYEVTENGTFEMLGFSKCNLMMYLNGNLQTADFFTVVPGDVVVINVFAFSYNGSEYSVNLDFTVAEAPVVEAPRLEDGTYVIFYGELTFQALAEDKTYGYAPAGDVNNPTALDIVTITNTEDGKFTMTDAYGRTIYMTGTYNSFNVTTDEVTEGHEWVLEDVGNGSYYVKNVLKEKYIAYSESYATWGCYASISETSAVNVVAFSLETPCEHNDVNDWEYDENGHWTACAECGEIVDEGDHDFEEGVCFCGYADPNYQPSETPEIPEGGIALELGNSDLNAGFVDENFNWNPEIKNYYYVAEQDGTLYVTVRAFGYGDFDAGESMLENTSWAQLSLNGELFTSMTQTVEVKTGDVVVITLNSVDGDRYFAKINLSYEGFYEEALGTELNPIPLAPSECPTTTVEIPAGETVWYALDYEFEGYTLYIRGENAYVITKVFDDMLSTWVDKRIDAVDGVVTFPVNVYEIQIGNAGEAAASFELEAFIPVGAEKNPDSLSVGEHVVNMVEGSYGYFFETVATGNGTMTITVTGDSYWEFYVENANDPDDWSDDFSHWAGETDPESTNTVTFDVTAGDFITLTLRLYDADYNYVAGTLNVNVEFTPAGDDSGESDVLAQETVDVPASWSGKSFTYDVPSDGFATLVIDSHPENTSVEYAFAVVGGSKTYFQSHKDGLTQTIEVKAGEQIKLELCVLGDNGNGAYVGGEVSFTITLSSGEEEDPFDYENAVEVIFDMNEEFTVGTATVTIPAGQTGYYFSYGIGGMVLTVTDAEGNVVSTETLPASMGREPVYFSVVNNMEGDVSSNVVMGDVNGDGNVNTTDAKLVMQRELGLIDDAALDMVAADVNGDGEVNTTDAKLIMQFELGLITEFPAEPPVATATFTLTITYPVGTFPNPDQLVEGYNSANVTDGGMGYYYTYTAEEDTLLVLSMLGNNWFYGASIARADGTYSYPDVHWTSEEPMVSMQVLQLYAGDVVELNIATDDYSAAVVEFNAYTCAGTAESPIQVQFNWNEEWTAGSLNIDMPAGDYVFEMMTGSGMVLTVDGVVTEMTGDGWFDPITFSATVAEAGIVPMTLTYPVGTYYNPEQLGLGYNTANVDESGAGYWYTYTAEADTLFVLSMFGENWFYSAMIMRADGTYGYPDGHWTSEETLVPMQVLELKAGDVLLLNFGTDDGAAGAVAFTASVCTGTAESPIPVTFMFDEAYTQGFLNIDMPAGDYVFEMMTGSGMILTVDGVVTEMTGDGWFDPITFSATVAEAGIVPMTLTYPVGTYYNPEQLGLGYNTANVDESGAGYWYTYTAEADTLFVLSMMGENWFYSAMIMRADGTYGYPDGHWTSEETLVPMQVLELKAGDVLLLNFGTDDGAAGAVAFTASVCTGTAESPIPVQFVWNEAYSSAALNIDLPAGDFVFEMWSGAGMNLTVGGVETEMTGDGWYDPILFSATVAEAGVVPMTLTYDLGTYYNPQALEMGYNVADVVDTDQGYWYTYTAESDCLFVLSMSCDNWFYSAMIQRADGTYGYPDGHWTSEETMVTMQVVQLYAGDVLLLNIATDDYTAAAVAFTASVCTGTAESPIPVQFVWNEAYSSAALNIDLPAGDFVFEMWSGAGMNLTVDGVVTEMTGDGWYDPIIFSATVAEAGVVPMTLTYDVGTYYNPEQLTVGSIVADVVDTDQGYWYTFTAEEDCLLTITMTCENWFYSAMIQRADGTFAYPDGHWTSEDVQVPAQTLELYAGDVLLLNIATDDYTAALVTFDVTVSAMPVEAE